MSREDLLDILSQHEESYLGGFVCIPSENYRDLVSQILQEWQ